MTDFVFTLTDGTYEIALAYDAATQDVFRLQQGVSIGGEEVLVTLHQGDFEPPVPVLGTNPLRAGMFSLDIRPGNANSTLNNEAMLRRWIDGKDQQALRYHTTGDVDKIYLKVRNKDATSYTYHDVLWGNVDSGGSYFTNAAQVTQFARAVTIQLYLEATGYGDIITMRNDLKNPAFLIGTGGLASNWAEVGTPATSFTSASLIGGLAQRCVSASANHGVISDTITNAAFNDAVAYVWLYIESGEVRVRIYDTTAAASVVAKDIDATDSGGTSDRSMTDASGNTWYRVSMAGSFTAGNDCRLEIYAINAAATFNVDACYFEYNGEGVIPEGWVSYKTIYNRMDQTAANPDRLNYIDTWGIPGDTEADIRYKVTAGASSLGVGVILARGIGNAIVPGNITNQNHWLESASATEGGTSNAAWSTDSDVSYSGGSAKRLTASSDGGTGTLTWTISGDAARRFVTSLRAVWVQMAASATTPTISFSCTAAGADYAHSYTANPLAAGSVLHLNSIGILNGKGQLPESVPDTAKPDLSFVLTVAGVPNTITVDIDGVWLLYGDEEDYTIWTLLGSGFGNNEQFWIDGINGGVINETTGVYEPQVLGSQSWKVAPGAAHNRMLFLVIQNTTQYTVSIALDYEVTVQVRPRTRHLLGTTGVMTP